MGWHKQGLAGRPRADGYTDSFVHTDGCEVVGGHENLWHLTGAGIIVSQQGRCRASGEASLMDGSGGRYCHALLVRALHVGSFGETHARTREKAVSAQTKMRSVS